MYAASKRSWMNKVSIMGIASLQSSGDECNKDKAIKTAPSNQTVQQLKLNRTFGRMDGGGSRHPLAT